MSPNLAAFLRVIRAGESGQTDAAYRTLFGGGLFDSFADHPRQVITRGALSSTAAGAYQFLSRTWDECAKALKLPDFSPASQDAAAVFLIQRRGALADVEAGRIEQAIAKTNKEWASLPGSPYGQPTRTLPMALATYERYGGVLAGSTPAPTATPPTPQPAQSWRVPAGDLIDDSPPAAPAQEQAMPFPAILAALLPSLIDAVPKLASIFKPGSEVAERNVQAVQVAFDVAKSAIGATNEQELIQRVQSDPAAAAAVGAAVEANWFLITKEAGGGGIDGARKADAVMQSTGDIRKSASFWIALLLLPLVYLLVLSLIGLVGTAQWSDDVRAGLAGSLISAIVGGLVGYYYGQTTSRNRTTKE